MTGKMVKMFAQINSLPEKKDDIDTKRYGTMLRSQVGLLLQVRTYAPSSKFHFHQKRMQ